MSHVDREESGVVADLLVQRPNQVEAECSENPKRRNVATVNENSAKPQVEWETATVSDLGYDMLELHGVTPAREMILAHAAPPADRDYHDWLHGFETGEIKEVPISIDSYFGPDIADADEQPEMVGVEHVIYIGHGLASWEGSALHVTLSPEVFRDAAASLLSDSDSEYADIERRIFSIFKLLDMESFDRFLEGLGTTRTFPALDADALKLRPLTPTSSKLQLRMAELLNVLCRADGVVSCQQLHMSIPCQERSLKKWLADAGLWENRPKRITGVCLTSGELIESLLPWFRDHRPTAHATEFARLAIEAGLIKNKSR